MHAMGAPLSVWIRLCKDPRNHNFDLDKTTFDPVDVIAGLKTYSK